MDKTVSDLLEDAVLVASYGQRSGRFKDAALFAAIQKANAAEPLDWSSPELADLQAALNNAVRAIEPVTLVDLKRGWNPFDKSSERGRAASDIGKAVFVAAAVLLIFLCGYYTLWHKRATLLLDDLSVAKAEQQTAIINEVFFRLVGAGEDALAPDLGSPGSLSRITIREKIDQLRAIERAMIENKRDYNEIVVSTVPGKRFYYEFLGLFNRPPDYASASNYMAANAQQPEPPPDAAPSGAPSGLQAAVLNRCVGAGPPGADKSDAFAEPAAATGVWWFNSLVTEQDQLLGQIRCIIGLQSASGFALAGFNGSDFNYMNDPANLAQTAEVLGLWVLPGLYGALGAVMFYMRAFLNPLHPDPKPFDVLLRVSLGSFAGIVVAWFWSPSLTQQVGVADIRLGVLTLAFLLGFGIDVFFALLDRLVTLVTGAINRLGVPS